MKVFASLVTFKHLLQRHSAVAFDYAYAESFWFMQICVFIQKHENDRMIMMMSSPHHPLCKTSPRTTHSLIVSPKTPESKMGVHVRNPPAF